MLDNFSLKWNLNGQWADELNNYVNQYWILLFTNVKQKATLSNPDTSSRARFNTSLKGLFILPVIWNLQTFFRWLRVKTTVITFIVAHFRDLTLKTWTCQITFMTQVSGTINCSSTIIGLWCFGIFL